MAPSKIKTQCTHDKGLQDDVSDYASVAKFTRPDLTARKAAATPSGQIREFWGISGSTDEEITFAYTFPGPLVLPDDALAIDPKDPSQSLRSWTREKARNPFTEVRKTLYVATMPTIPGGLSFMKAWSEPAKTTATARKAAHPRPEDLVSYLEAFYYPLPVKLYPGTVAFTAWEDSTPNSRPKAKTPIPSMIGLQIGTEGITGVRTRPCPDKTFKRQLNLNDILDAVQEALPSDSYAMVLVTEQDLYEDEDDDFCCGRAYGNSRIAVVSTARYHPALDAGIIDREHMWPTSHCIDYVRSLIGEEMWADEAPWRRVPKGLFWFDKKRERFEQTGMFVAVKAAMEAPKAEENLAGLWFSRVARTVSHELGHCLCLAHCSYYACVMQSTAGMAEDVRQPPYLCPVCLAKVTRAAGDVAKGVGEKELQVRRYRALRAFCKGWGSVGMFAGYYAWLGKRIEHLGGES